MTRGKIISIKSIAFRMKMELRSLNKRTYKWSVVDRQITREDELSSN